MSYREIHLITACVVILPGMENALECMLESLQLNSTNITKVLVAVRTLDSFERIEYRDKFVVKYFSFWFDKGPTPAGNTHWKGRGYSHAVGLHECLIRARSEYILLTEPDVIFLKKHFDELFLEVLNKHDVAITGVTRAADPRGHTLFDQQAYGAFPTVIACLMRQSSLPPNDYLKGKLKMRPHAFPHANTEEDTYENLDGCWLLQSAIPEYISQYPNPDGEFPVGCNLYLWFKNKRWLSFHCPKSYKEEFCNATTYNINNFNLSNDFYGMEPLLFHSGHSGLNKLSSCLQSLKTGNLMEIKQVTDLDHTLKVILLQKWPHRSPYVYVEVVKDVIVNKTVCDIGCAEGDQLAMFAQYAKGVLGVELNSVRAQPAIDRGFDVRFGNYKDIGIPEADVYFSWIGAQEDAQFVEDLAKTGRKAVSLLFCRKGNHVKDIVEKWGGELREFDYHEPYSDIPGFDKDGKGWAGVIRLNGA